jgi:hypothetical protein
MAINYSSYSWDRTLAQLYHETGEKLDLEGNFTLLSSITY